MIRFFRGAGLFGCGVAVCELVGNLFCTIAYNVESGGPQSGQATRDLSRNLMSDITQPLFTFMLSALVCVACERVRTDDHGPISS